MPSSSNRRGPFDYVNAINKTYDIVRKEPHPDGLKNYEPFVINRAFSYYQDTLNLASLMNNASVLPKQMQYDFLINTVRPRARYGKWGRAQDVELLKMVSQYFQVNHEVARHYMTLMSLETIDQIVATFDESGGVNNEE